MSKSKRSKLMSRIRSKDTEPEMIVRKTVHALGYRYRLHRRDLPGTPDLVFSGSRKVVFVHGCFWHRHKGCQNATEPKTRPDFWKKKFRRNVERDKEAIAKLEAMGWQVLIIWECETSDPAFLEFKLQHFLNQLDEPN